MHFRRRFRKVRKVSQSATRHFNCENKRERESLMEQMADIPDDPPWVLMPLQNSRPVYTERSQSKRVRMAEAFKSLDSAFRSENGAQIVTFFQLFSRFNEGGRKKVFCSPPANSEIDVSHAKKPEMSRRLFRIVPKLISRVAQKKKDRVG